MSNVINGLMHATTGITGSKLWSSILPFVPFIIIIFIVSFGFNKLKEWLQFNQAIRDPDCLGYYKNGKYHKIRDPEYYE